MFIFKYIHAAFYIHEYEYKTGIIHEYSRIYTINSQELF